MTGDTLKVWVVDDDQSVRWVLEKALRFRHGIVLAGLVVVVVSGWLAARLGTEFIPLNRKVMVRVESVCKARTIMSYINRCLAMMISA